MEGAREIVGTMVGRPLGCADVVGCAVCVKNLAARSVPVTLIPSSFKSFVTRSRLSLINNSNSIG